MNHINKIFMFFTVLGSFYCFESSFKPAYSFSPNVEPSQEFKLEIIEKLPHVLSIFLNGAIASTDQKNLEIYSGFELIKLPNKNIYHIILKDTQGDPIRVLEFKWDEFYYSYKIKLIDSKKSSLLSKDKNKKASPSIDLSIVFDISEAVRNLLSFDINQMTTFASESAQSIAVVKIKSDADIYYPNEKSKLSEFVGSLFSVASAENTEEALSKYEIYNQGLMHALDPVFHYLLFDIQIPSEATQVRVPLYSIVDSEDDSVK